MLSLRAVLPRYRPSLEQVMIIPHYRGLFLCARKQICVLWLFIISWRKMEGGIYGEKTGRQEFGRIVVAVSHISCAA